MAEIIKPFPKSDELTPQPWPIVEPVKPGPGEERKSFRHSGDTNYNGFTRVERLASIKPQGKAKRSNNPPEPTACSVTGFSDTAAPRGRGYIFTHLEDYRPESVSDWLPCCRMVHSRLHRRFEKPRAWYRIVYENYRHGAWFTLLTMNPESMIVPYTYLYPNYLPGADDAWGDMADDLGIHREMFNPDNDELVGLWMPQPGLWNIERNEQKRAHG